MAYDIPIAVENGGDPANDFNAARAAILDMDTVRLPALAVGSQYIPDVGQTFSSAYYISVSNGTLRAMQDHAVPILIPVTIGVDQLSFYVATGATVNTLADLRLRTLNPDYSWTTVATLATDIAVATGGVTVYVNFTQITLTPAVWGFSLFQNGTADTVLKVNGGKMVGPGIGDSGSYSQVGFPINTNTALTTAVPLLRFRRSA